MLKVKLRFRLRSKRCSLSHTTKFVTVFVASVIIRVFFACPFWFCRIVTYDIWQLTLILHCVPSISVQVEVRRYQCITLFVMDIDILQWWFLRGSSFDITVMYLIFCFFPLQWVRCVYEVCLLNCPFIQLSSICCFVCILWLYQTRNLTVYSLHKGNSRWIIYTPCTNEHQWFFRMSKITFHPYYNFQTQSSLVSKTVYMR